MSETLNYNINVKTNAGESLGSLKKQLREAQAEVAILSEKFGATSEQAINAAKRAAQLKDRIGDAKALTDSFNPDAKFTALSKTIGIAAGGFAALQGAMALVGTESEDVAKNLQKVQGALALSQGISQIGELGDAFDNMKAVAVNAFKAIKGAIGSTGIGLLVVALGTIVANWDKIKSAVSGVSKEQEQLNAKTKANVDAQKKKLDAIGGQENILKLQGKSEKQILELKVAQTKQVIAATKEQIKQNIATLKAQVEAETRNKRILKGILDFINAPITLLLTAVRQVAKLVNVDFNFDPTEFVSNLVFDPAQVQAEGQAAIEEQKKTLQALENQQAGYQLEIQNINKKASEKTKKDKKDDTKDLEQLQKEKDQRESEAIQIQIKAYRATLDKRNQDLLAAEDEFENKKGDLIRANNFDFTKLEEEFRLKKIEINKTYDKIEEEEALKLEEKKKALEQTNKQREFETRQLQADTVAEKVQLELEALDNEYKLKYDLAVKNGEDLLLLEENYAAKKLAITQKSADEEEAVDKALKEAKEQALLSGLNFLGAVAGENEKISNIIFGIQKALEIGKIITSTAGAIAAVGTQTALIPPLVPPGIPNPAAIKAAVLGAKKVATLKLNAASQIATIAGATISKFKGSSSGGIGGSAPTSTTAPIEPPRPQPQTTNISQESINALGNQAIRAYVVETDVTSNQKRVQAIKQRARFS
jgi:hypothetical protein